MRSRSNLRRITTNFWWMWACSTRISAGQIDRRNSSHAPPRFCRDIPLPIDALPSIASCAEKAAPLMRSR